MSDVGWFGSPGLQLCVIEGDIFSSAGISERVDLLCSEFSFSAHYGIKRDCGLCEFCL